MHLHVYAITHSVRPKRSFVRLILPTRRTKGSQRKHLNLLSMNDKRVLSCAAVTAPHVLYSIDSSKWTPDQLRNPAFNKTANGVLQPMVPRLNSSHHVNFGYKLKHSCKVMKEWQVQSLEHPTVFSLDFR